MESRTTNSKNNIIAGLVASIIGIIFPFINRTVILYTLGYEYQGLNTLFTSILSTLSLAELGISSAVTFCLYRAIAENNIDEQCALLNFFKKVYRVIGILILICGIVLTPFISIFIKGDYPERINIYFLFILFLVQTVVSYLFLGYKSIIFSAYQKEVVISKVQIGVTILRYMAQFLVLIIFKDFYLYVIMAIIGSIVQNGIVALLAGKYYPDIVCKGNISRERKAELKSKIGGLLVNRLSNEIRNSSDNIVVSLFLGLKFVTSYGNYFYIMNSIYCMFGIITRGMIASVGNSVVTETKEKNYQDFLMFGCLFSFLNCVATSCMFSIFQPFMELWAGEGLMLNGLEMTMFCLYFYVLNVNYPINLYYETNGLWDKTKKIFILSAVVNLLLNFILCYWFQIGGILLATIVTIILFSIIGRLKILYNSFFCGISIIEYLTNEIKYFLCVVLACILIGYINNQIDINGVLGIIIKLFVAISISCLLWFLMFRKSIHFKKGKTLISRLKK